MINTATNLRNFLLQNAALVTLTGQRIWVNTDLPPSYQPIDGGAVLINNRPGNRLGGVDYTSKILAESFSAQCYGVEPDVCQDVYRALFDAIDCKSNMTYQLFSGELEEAGVLLTAPETDWFFIQCFFRCMFRNDS